MQQPERPIIIPLVPEPTTMMKAPTEPNGIATRDPAVNKQHPVTTPAIPPMTVFLLAFSLQQNLVMQLFLFLKKR